MKLASRFGRNQTSLRSTVPLTDLEMMEVAPSTVLTLLAASKSQREIARVTEVERTQDNPQFGTARHPLWEIQIPPGRPPARGLTFPHSRPPGFGDRVAPSACEPHHAFVTEQLRLRRNYTAIYQDLVDRFGFTASYTSVTHFLGTLVAKLPAQFDRLEFAPSEATKIWAHPPSVSAIVGPA